MAKIDESWAQKFVYVLKDQAKKFKKGSERFKDEGKIESENYFKGKTDAYKEIAKDIQNYIYSKDD